MKRVALFCLVSAMFCPLLMPSALRAQSPEYIGFTSADSLRALRELRARDSLFNMHGFKVPDSIARLTPLPVDYRTSGPLPVYPVVSMSSVIADQYKALPSSVIVLNNNTLRVGRVLNISNGQAWNWGPVPNYLDARTLSMPMPR